MDIAVNAEVHCTDGFYGHLTCIVLNPATEHISHVAVRKDGLFSRTLLVPVTHIVDSTPDKIQLDLSKKELDNDMPPFLKTEFLDHDLPDTIYTTDLMWPHLISNVAIKTVEHENIPLEELAVSRGAVVQASDGPLGTLEDFLVDPDTKHVSRIVVRAGHWYAHSKIAIPVSAIDHFDEDAIYLALSKHEARQLAVA